MSYENFDPNDLSIQAYSTKPEGNFGPHRIPHGIRAIHLPTGTVVTCEADRGQHRNRHLALTQLWEQVQGKPTYQELAAKVDALQKEIEFSANAILARMPSDEIHSIACSMLETAKINAASCLHERDSKNGRTGFIAGADWLYFSQLEAVVLEDDKVDAANRYAEGMRKKLKGENYFDVFGTLRNSDGSRSIFDDVDR